ncbi:hypothetical protein FOZ62_032046 [Perkinsus olseni]|uniref:Uncharacterized protein n=1 Tax=Perkinsus olseni TaxID=32597 RepID=A0A7J6QBR4_PEROL|nr:hypothetical protein FOZ62_032046 [Perkinsus olseni]
MRKSRDTATSFKQVNLPTSAVPLPSATAAPVASAADQSDKSAPSVQALNGSNGSNDTSINAISNLANAMVSFINEKSQRRSGKGMVIVIKLVMANFVVIFVVYLAISGAIVGSFKLHCVMVRALKIVLVLAVPTMVMGIVREPTKIHLHIMYNFNNQDLLLTMFQLQCRNHPMLLPRSLPRPNHMALLCLLPHLVCHYRHRETEMGHY